MKEAKESFLSHVCIEHLKADGNLKDFSRKISFELSRLPTSLLTKVIYGFNGHEISPVTK